MGDDAELETIERLLKELARLARHAKTPMLVYLLELALEECVLELQKRRTRPNS